MLSHNLTPLQFASLQGDICQVVTILKTNSINDNSKNDFQAALILAVEFEHFFLAQIFLLLGADIEECRRLAIKQNNHEVAVNLELVKFNPTVLRALLYFIITNNAVDMFALIADSVRLYLLRKIDVVLDMDAAGASSSSSSNDYFTQEDVAAFIELAASLNLDQCVYHLLQLSPSIRYVPTIRTAGYWAACHGNVELLADVIASKDHLQATIDQLYSDKRFDCLPQVLTLAQNQGYLDDDKPMQKVELEATNYAAMTRENISHHHARKNWVSLHGVLEHGKLELISSCHIGELTTIGLFSAPSAVDQLLQCANAQDQANIIKQFPGVYASLLASKLANRTYADFNQREKTLLKSWSASNDRKKTIIQSLLEILHGKTMQDRDFNSALLADIFNALSIPHNLNTMPATFLRIENDALHLIINFLNGEEQFNFSILSRRTRRLVNDPQFSAARQIIRDRGRNYEQFIHAGDALVLEVQTISKQLLLINQFLPTIENEIEAFGFFSHRFSQGGNRSRAHFTISMFMLLAFVLNAFYYINSAIKNEIINDDMKQLSLVDETNVNYTCYDYIGADIRCRTDDSLFRLPNPIAVKCQPLCDIKDGMYSSWAGTLAGTIISGVYLLIQLMYNAKIFRLEGRDRFERLTLNRFSQQSAQLMDDLISEFPQDLNLQTTVNEVKRFLAEQRPYLVTRKVEAMDRLRFYRPAAFQIEVIEDHEENQPAPDNDNLHAPLLG